MPLSMGPDPRVPQLQGETRDLIAQLVQASVEATERETKMLFWTRVAGVGALLALAVSIIAIVVTVAVA